MWEGGSWGRIRPEGRLVVAPYCYEGFGCVLEDESHLAGVGDELEGETGEEGESGGPIDEEGAAYEVVSRDDAGGIGLEVAFSGDGPESGVVALR